MHWSPTSSEPGRRVLRCAGIFAFGCSAESREKLSLRLFAVARHYPGVNLELGSAVTPGKLSMVMTDPRVPESLRERAATNVTALTASLSGIQQKQKLISALDEAITAKTNLQHINDKLSLCDQALSAQNAHAETLRVLIAMREASAPEATYSFWGQKETAAYLRKSPATLRNWRSEYYKSGVLKGPLFRKHGGDIVYLAEAVKEWSIEQTPDFESARTNNAPQRRAQAPPVRKPATTQGHRFVGRGRKHNSGI
jgi:hypothetical protein